MSPEKDQNASDVEAALPDGHPGADETTQSNKDDKPDPTVDSPTETVDTVTKDETVVDSGENATPVEPTPGPAAASLDPTLRDANTGGADTQGDASKAVPVTQVAPNSPDAQPYINPDPDSAISEPPMVDAQGKVVPVVAPANQDAPISPQVEAQEAAQKEAEEPPTIAELAACANALRSGMPDSGGLKVAGLLDRVTEKRIEQDEQDLSEKRDSADA